MHCRMHTHNPTIISYNSAISTCEKGSSARELRKDTFVWFELPK